MSNEEILKDFEYRFFPGRISAEQEIKISYSDAKDFLLSALEKKDQEFREKIEGGIEVILRPKVDPNLSCPQSVLHLPTVINGIKNGEIILEHA